MHWNVALRLRGKAAGPAHSRFPHLRVTPGLQDGFFLRAMQNDKDRGSTSQYYPTFLPGCSWTWQLWNVPIFCHQLSPCKPSIPHPQRKFVIEMEMGCRFFRWTVCSWVRNSLAEGTVKGLQTQYSQLYIAAQAYSHALKIPGCLTKFFQSNQDTLNCFAGADWVLLVWDSEFNILVKFIVLKGPWIINLVLLSHKFLYF